MKIECTREEVNTIYTALRLELERNWGKDEKIVKALEAAIAAVRSAK